jgi:guanylate kinase
VIIVVSGPGGVGKGTVVARLVARDPRLRLSRSWTTRGRRPGESADAYVFVDRDAFESRVAAGGFLEWAEFLGNLYGTPVPDDLPDDVDLLLEIDVQGAEQVHRRRPDALLVLLRAPSEEVQRDRLEGRGDPPDQVERRVRVARDEIARARALGAVEVVNDDLETAVDRLAAVIDRARAGGPMGDEGSAGSPW